MTVAVRPSRFQSIAGRMFGHTEHKHNLITQQERAKEKFNVRVGSQVQFTLDGVHYRGFVNRITRRATVLVIDPVVSCMEMVNVIASSMCRSVICNWPAPNHILPVGWLSSPSTFLL